MALPHEHASPSWVRAHLPVGAALIQKKIKIKIPRLKFEVGNLEI
jgi:hypothetical protein